MELLHSPLPRLRLGQSLGAVVALTAFLAISHFATSRPVVDESLGASVPRFTQPFRSAHLPFKARDVISYFSEALGVPAAQVGNAAMFSSQGDEQDLHAFRVIVAADGADLFVSVTGYGDYALSQVREFFEAPFFSREETLGLYAALDRARPTQTLAYRRFTARVDLTQHEDDFHVVLQFSPPNP